MPRQTFTVALGGQILNVHKDKAKSLVMVKDPKFTPGKTAYTKEYLFSVVKRQKQGGKRTVLVLTYEGPVKVDAVPKNDPPDGGVVTIPSDPPGNDAGGVVEYNNEPPPP